MKAKLILLTVLATASIAVAQSSSSTPEIILDRADAEIFPESWRGSRINANAQPLPEADQPKCHEIVDKALAMYPASVLNANLKKVYVLGALSYSDVGTGGTNSRGSVYVVSNEKFKPTEFEKNIHAEFSSILLRNFPGNLDKDAWQQINGSDFHYLGSGVQAIKEKKASLRLVDDLHENGFLNQYGTASMEEDFNTYAARLLYGEPALWDAIDKYPKVKAKAYLVIAFYGKLDASFTEDFFKSLRKH